MLLLWGSGERAPEMDDQVLEMILKRLDSIDRHMEDFGKRTTKLESWNSYLKGAFAVLAGAYAWLIK